MYLAEVEDFEDDGDTFESLTVSDEDWRAIREARQAVTDAEKRVAELEAERSGLDAERRALESAREDRARDRAEQERIRHEAARRGEVGAVEDAVRRIDALDLIDSAQAERVEEIEQRIAEVIDSLLPAAESAVEQAKAAHAELDDAAGGRWPRSIVSHVALIRMSAVAKAAAVALYGDDPVDAQDVAEALWSIPTEMARQALDDPERFGSLAAAVLDPKRENADPEPWHWRPIVGPDGKVIGVEKAPGRAPVSRAAEAVSAGAPQPGSFAGAEYGALGSLNVGGV